LKNIKKVVVEFERRISAEVRKQGKVKYCRRKKLWKKRITGKVHDKDVI